jgi:polar amino acid transport system substrate-binding protein
MVERKYMKKTWYACSIMMLVLLSGCIGQKEKDDHILIVGTESNFPPFSSKDGTELVGFDIDLVKEVAKRLGKTVEFQDMSFEALIPQAEIGTVQVIAAGMTPTENRAKKVFFTKPYIVGDSLLIVGLVDRLDVGSLEALKQEKRVVVNQGYTADLFMSTVEGPELIRLETPAEAFLALEQGRADAFVTARNTLVPFFKKHDAKQYVQTPIQETVEKTAMIVSKKYPELLHEIQAALDEIEADGTMTTLKQKWGIDA